MANAEAPEAPYINHEVYELAKRALLSERSRGINLIGSPIRLPVVMPEELGGHFVISAVINGNYRNEFLVQSTTLKLGKGDLSYTIHLSDTNPEVHDEFTDDFVTALANFDAHDHNICYLRYKRNSMWAHRFVDLSESLLSTTDAAAVQFKDAAALEVPQAFYDRRAAQQAS